MATKLEKRLAFSLSDMIQLADHIAREQKKSRLISVYRPMIDRAKTVMAEFRQKESKDAKSA